MTLNQGRPLNLAEIHVDRRNADMVLNGRGNVVHPEFQRRADPTMADRMLIYRSLLRVEPKYAGKLIQQHVIVLGKGTSPTQIEDPPDLRFAFETHERTDRLTEILRIVTAAEPESLSQDLVRNALAYASVVLLSEDIERILEEFDMPADMIRDTEFAQKLIDEGRAEGRLSSVLEILQRREVGDNAPRIAAALIAENESSAATRAAFEPLEKLTALAD